MDVQYRLSSWRVLVGVAILFVGGIAWAEENPPPARPQGATTLVGRGKDFTVIEKNGESRSVRTEGLVLKNRATVEVQEKPSPEELARWAERKKTQDEKKTLAQKQKKVETKEKKAAPVMSPGKQEAIEMLRKYQKWGTLYFYTTDNKPVSNDELTKRLDSGNIEDLKIVDGQRKEYSIRPAPVEKSASDTETSANVAEAPAKDAEAPPPGPRQRK